MIEWKKATIGGLFTPEREVLRANIGPYDVTIKDGTVAVSIVIYTIKSLSEPYVVLHAIDLDAAKKAAIDWIRNDLWNTLGQIGISINATTAGAGHAGPTTSGTIWLKPYKYDGTFWVYSTNAQHNP